MCSCKPATENKTTTGDLSPNTAKDIDAFLLALKSNPNEKFDFDHWTEIRKAADTKAQVAFEAGLVALYLQQVKKSVIDPQNHGGWPCRSFLVFDSSLRNQLFTALKNELESHPSALIKYALICPALYAGDDALVSKLLESLEQEDKFYSEKANASIAIWKPYISKHLKTEALVWDLWSKN